MWVFGMYDSIVLVKIEFLLKKERVKIEFYLGNDLMAKDYVC